MQPQPHDPARQSAVQPSAWRRFWDAAKIVARYISPMDGPRRPFSDEPRRGA